MPPGFSIGGGSGASSNPVMPYFSPGTISRAAMSIKTHKDDARAMDFPFSSSNA